MVFTCHTGKAIDGRKQRTRYDFDDSLQSPDSAYVCQNAPASSAGGYQAEAKMERS